MRARELLQAIYLYLLANSLASLCLADSSPLNTEAAHSSSGHHQTGSFNGTVAHHGTHRLRGRSPHATPTFSMHHAQLSVDCAAFTAPIKKKRDACLSNASEEVDICVYFASDYRFVVPFLVHHLSLGVSRIFIYNNDEKVAWYNHPAVLCLLAAEWVHIQPWFGEKELMRGLDHCYKESIVDSRQYQSDSDKKARLHHIWGTNFDIDEMLVLHNHTCFAHLLTDLQAPSLALNWAFYVPEAPLDNFGRTGNLGFLPDNHHLRSRNTSIVLPHDILTRRRYENEHIKTVTRLTCVDHFVNEHCPQFTSSCPYGGKVLDPQGHYIPCGPWTPWVDNHYPVAQLNHYWTLSLQDYLRKIHRGKGGSYAKVDGGQFRNTREFFNHAHRSLPFVSDDSFIRYYGAYFDMLKEICPLCFDTSFYYLNEQNMHN